MVLLLRKWKLIKFEQWKKNNETVRIIVEGNKDKSWTVASRSGPHWPLSPLSPQTAPFSRFEPSPLVSCDFVVSRHSSLLFRLLPICLPTSFFWHYTHDTLNQILFSCNFIFIFYLTFIFIFYITLFFLQNIRFNRVFL